MGGPFRASTADDYFLLAVVPMAEGDAGVTLTIRLIRSFEYRNIKVSRAAQVSDA